MRRQTLVYSLVLIIAAVGLWAVLQVGNRLQAAADLSGVWKFDSGPLGPNADGPESLGEGFEIDQSGQFLRVRFASGRRLDLRAQVIPLGAFGDTPAEVELVDGQWRLKGTVREEQGKLIGVFELKGPQRARFVAYREPPATETPPPVEPELPADLDPAATAVAATPSTQPTPLEVPLATTADESGLASEPSVLVPTQPE